MSLKFFATPGFDLSLYEKMICFTGCSSETNRMKGKTINEGYKFFCISDSNTGYVHYFIPDGRVASNSSSSNMNEYQRSPDTSKLLAMIKLLIEKIGLKKLTGARNTNFLIGIDSDFTFSRVMQEIRNKGIGTVGTS